MKITVDKELTTLAGAEKVKADIKEFKARYTAGDLWREFFDQTGIDCPWNCEILQVTGDAFPGGTFYDNETQFSLKIIAKGFYEFYEINFYCDSNLKVDTRDFKDICSGSTSSRKLYSVERYVKQ